MLYIICMNKDNLGTFFKKHAPIVRTTALLNKMSDGEGVVPGSTHSILFGDVEASCFVDFYIKAHFRAHFCLRLFNETPIDVCREGNLVASGVLPPLVVVVT